MEKMYNIEGVALLIAIVVATCIMAIWRSIKEAKNRWMEEEINWHRMRLWTIGTILIVCHLLINYELKIDVGLIFDSFIAGISVIIFSLIVYICALIFGVLCVLVASIAPSPYEKDWPYQN